MSTEKFFWTDPYLKEIKSTITSVNGSILTLDKTILFSFSGGQQSDEGTIGDFNVKNSYIQDKEIFYEIEDHHNLKKGDEVAVKLNWDKRYKIMRLHFTAELILELVYQGYSNSEKIGANITSEKARIDFQWNGNISEIFSELKEKFNAIIKNNYTIISEFSYIEKELRYWEIKEFAKVACGGTHLKTTGEVGEVVLKRVNLGSNKERIEISLVYP